MSAQNLEHLPLAALTPYAANSRTHSGDQVRQIARSIEEFGFTNPVLIDGAGGIIAGHGRVQAAQLLGLATVPCLRLAHLTDAQKRAYIIADNQLALNAGWDESVLAAELQALDGLEFDLGLIGFDVDALNALLSQPTFTPGTEEDQGKLDQLEPKWTTCPPCGKQYDLREQE
jgi:ParB-like chromosome segregation protein Spo0J